MLKSVSLKMVYAVFKKSCKYTGFCLIFLQFNMQYGKIYNVYLCWRGVCKI